MTAKIKVSGIRTFVFWSKTNFPSGGFSSLMAPKFWGGEKLGNLRVWQKIAFLEEIFLAHNK